MGSFFPHPVTVDQHQCVSDYVLISCFLVVSGKMYIAVVKYSSVCIGLNDFSKAPFLLYFRI